MIVQNFEKGDPGNRDWMRTNADRTVKRRRLWGGPAKKQAWREDPAFAAIRWEEGQGWVGHGENLAPVHGDWM